MTVAWMVRLMPISADWGTPAQKAQAVAYHSAFELMQSKLERDVARIWAQSLKFTDYQQQRIFLTNMLWDLQQVYGGDATALAAEYLNYLRDGADLPMVEAGAALVDEVSAAVGVSLSSKEPSVVLQGSMQRLMMNAYRDTMMGSAVAAERRFARVAEPGACPFCLMLASRGGVYLSKNQASFVGAGGLRRHYSDGRFRGYRMKKGVVRGSRPAGAKFHDHCRCHVVEVADDSELPESNKWLQEAWGEATSGVDGMKEKQAAWAEWLRNNNVPWEPSKAA